MLNEPYPSDGMSRMLEDVDKLEQQVYLEKYCVFTEFDQLMQITIVVEYFKRTIPPLLIALRSEPEKARERAEEECAKLKDLAEMAQVSHQDLLYFERQIRKRFTDQRYCFIALTKDRKERNYYDLQERVDDLRYITVMECGNQECRARQADGAVLETCTGCEKAAYCNRECQRADWKKFHKRFCKSLAWDNKPAADSKPAPPVVQAQEEKEEAQEEKQVEEVADDETQ
jgi:hypothetical protein